jgi:hypothetical protein
VLVGTSFFRLLYPFFDRQEKNLRLFSRVGGRKLADTREKNQQKVVAAFAVFSMTYLQNLIAFALRVN